MRPGGPVSATPAGECRVFCRYLVGMDPTDYIVMCYVRALPSAAGHQDDARLLIDRRLLATARLGRVATRMADAYARRFRPYSALRRRLVLLLAILENSPPNDARLNSARVGSPLGIVTAMTAALLASGLALFAGMVLLGPVHLVSLLAGRGR